MNITAVLSSVNAALNATRLAVKRSARDASRREMAGKSTILRRRPAHLAKGHASRREPKTAASVRANGVAGLPRERERG